jgi:hypothetical protein
MLAFTDSIRQAPRGTSFAVGISDLLLLRFLHSFMPAHIDKGLLVEELLLGVADHLLAFRLDTEASNRLDKFSTDRQFATLFQLTKVLVMLWPMFRVRYFMDVIAHEIVELSLFHSFRELLQLLFGDVHLFTFNEGVIYLVLLFFRFRVQSNPVEVFGGVRVHLLFPELSWFFFA